MYWVVTSGASLYRPRRIVGAANAPTASRPRASRHVSAVCGAKSGMRRFIFGGRAVRNSIALARVVIGRAQRTAGVGVVELLPQSLGDGLVG